METSGRPRPAGSNAKEPCGSGPKPGASLRLQSASREQRELGAEPGAGHAHHLQGPATPTAAGAAASGYGPVAILGLGGPRAGWASLGPALGRLLLLVRPPRPTHLLLEMQLQQSPAVHDFQLL